MLPNLNTINCSLFSYMRGDKEKVIFVGVVYTHEDTIALFTIVCPTKDDAQRELAQYGDVVTIQDIETLLANIALQDMTKIGYVDATERKLL